MTQSLKKPITRVSEYIGLVLILVFNFFPIVWLGLTAFKLPKDAFTTKVIFEPTLENFRFIFISGPRLFGPLVVNSTLISALTVAIAIPLAAMCAYAFSRFLFMGKDALLLGVLVTQFIPPVVIVLPFFTLFKELRLLDTRIALIILNLSFVLPFAIWMIKGFIDGIPTEIEEAALVDGCTRFQTLRYVTFPLVMPGAITAAVFGFIQSWNEFLFALIMTRSKATTLTVGLLTFDAQRGVRWEAMAAAGLIVMVPMFILGLAIRKYFVRGLTMGAVK